MINKLKLNCISKHCRLYVYIARSLTTISALVSGAHLSMYLLKSDIASSDKDILI